MAVTKQELIDDIILRITKGEPSDDFELSPRQVAFWFDIVASDILPKYVDSKLRKSEGVPSIMIEIDDEIGGEVENNIMLDQYDNRVFIETEKEIMDLPKDNGVLRILTEEGQFLNRVSIERLDELNKMTFAKPSRDNMLYSKIDQKLYIHGLNPSHVGIVNFSVTYIPKFNLSDLEDDDTVKLPDELIGVISDAVEDKARRQMFGPADWENDAENDPNVVNGK